MESSYSYDHPRADDGVPFMMQVFQIREEKRSLVPAVTHLDGSGPAADSLILNQSTILSADRICKLTGIPMVLNTSFNENEPVVCNPQEALDCFLRTKMDALAIGDTIISRSPTA